MPPAVVVKHHNPVVKAQREAAARRVIGAFGDRLPDLKLICFLDDEDAELLKGTLGLANRGFYAPIKNTRQFNNFWSLWPEYLKDCVFVEDCSQPSLYKQIFDHAIYLYGGTCEHPVGLTMTLAHELQHFSQHHSQRKVWAANTLIPQLPRDLIAVLGLQWSDIPIEREARLVSKRIAVSLFGAVPVTQFIEGKVANSINVEDGLDWQFIQGLDTSVLSSDLGEQTRLIFQRLKGYQPELTAILLEMRGDPDVRDLDLNTLFESSSSAFRAASAS